MAFTDGLLKRQSVNGIYACHKGEATLLAVADSMHPGCQ